MGEADRGMLVMLDWDRHAQCHEQLIVCTARRVRRMCTRRVDKAGQTINARQNMLLQGNAGASVLDVEGKEVAFAWGTHVSEPHTIGEGRKQDIVVVASDGWSVATAARQFSKRRRNEIALFGGSFRPARVRYGWAESVVEEAGEAAVIVRRIDNGKLEKGGLIDRRL